MSLALTRIAWRVQMQPSLKMTLLALCEHADDDGACWPSIARLAEFTCISDRQVKRLVHVLIEQGFASVTANENGGKPGQTRRYQISLERLRTGDTGDTRDKLTRVTNDAETGDVGVTARVTNATETGDAGVTLSTIEPSLNLSSNDQSSSFDKFWSLYPIKQAKRKCAARWNARKLDHIAVTILADVERKSRLDRRWLDGFPPNPFTYINQERWNDPVIEARSSANSGSAVNAQFSDKKYSGSSEEQINDLLGGKRN